jgi:hypothetical protein
MVGSPTRTCARRRGGTRFRVGQAIDGKEGVVVVADDGEEFGAGAPKISEEPG